MSKEPPLNESLPLVLFADDEQELQKLISSELPRMGYRVAVCPDGLTAVTALQEQNYDCLIVDLDMPGMGGIEVLRRARELQPLIPAVILTGKPSQQSAIDAINLQAVSYLQKPCKLVDLTKTLAVAVERGEMQRQLAALQHRLRRAEGNRQLLGDAPSMELMRKRITKVAPTESTVLIRGETGTGKELVAHAIHDQSRRAKQPFVAVNCGALPETLIESELFGHSRGAFTGAEGARTGLFQLADHGTLFLDEIGELPLIIQAKLLRALEAGEIRRLGDDRTLTVDVRVIAATHRDLEKMVREGAFREDLLYRINPFEIEVPPLRERLEDLPLLVEHLLRRSAACRPMTEKSGEGNLIYTPETLAALRSHAWPGNVRELANVIEHAAILCDRLPLQVEHLPRHFRSRRLREEVLEGGPMSLEQLELIAIERSLARHAGNKPAVAQELGISMKTLYKKLNESRSSLRAVGS
jgi:two-component system NtrC family response regulator